MRARLVPVACLLLLALGSAASAQESAAFVAEPVPGSQTAPDGGYFLLDATPGDEIRQSIGLRNDSGGPLELRLDAVDAVTGQLGGASYALPEERPTRTGAWITLERSTVMLQPGASEIVSFTVVVPTDATPGEHLAGLSIAAPARQGDSAQSDEGQAGASIDVQTRHIIAVQVDLPGPTEPNLVVTGVTPAARPDGLYLEIGIENRGHRLTKAEGTVVVEDDFERTFAVDTFVPGTEIAYPVKWLTESRDGVFPASVELRYDGEVARWEGSFRVGEEVLDDLAERQVESPEQGSGGSGMPASVWAGAVAIGCLALAGTTFAVTRLLRPRGAHARKRGGARRRMD